MSRSNEELAERIQRGDWDASAELLSQNKGLLIQWAKMIQEQYGIKGIIEDLVQEGSIALLEAVKKYDPSREVKLMSFTAPAIRQAMRNCATSLGTVVSIPTSRLQQIQSARYFALQMPEERSQEQIEEQVAEKMSISPSAVHALLAQGDTLLTYAPLEDQKKTPSEFGNPESVYEMKLLSEHLFNLIETILTAREQTLVRYYFGLEASAVGGMTLEELAVRLNYNGPSGAQKALDRAIRKLRENFASGEWERWREAKRTIRNQ